MSLTLGARLQGAVHCCFEHAGQLLLFAPGSPGGAFCQIREGARMEEVTDEPLYRDRVRHRHRQGRHGGDDPGAIR